MSIVDSLDVDKLVKAGEIAIEAREHGASLVKPGASAREVCEEVEDLIRRRGGLPAFPCNFSVDEVAAHYTPGVKDDIRLKGTEVVKVDVGVHVDGWIADTAVTVDLSGRHESLLDAVRKALNQVVNIMKPNISVYMIGRTIETTLKKAGFKPVRNLTGHTIGRYLIHAGETIPNYADRAYFVKKLRPGTIVAVEPFGTPGRGLVREGPILNIYSYLGRRPRRPLSDEEYKVLEYIVENYRTLPFTPRWLAKEFGEKVEETVRSLMGKGVLIGYPILVEASKAVVAQFEHTFVILRDKVIVTTLRTADR